MSVVVIRWPSHRLVITKSCLLIGYAIFEYFDFSTIFNLDKTIRIFFFRFSNNSLLSAGEGRSDISRKIRNNFRGLCVRPAYIITVLPRKSTCSPPPPHTRYIICLTMSRVHIAARLSCAFNVIIILLCTVQLLLIIHFDCVCVYIRLIRSYIYSV